MTWVGMECTAMRQHVCCYLEFVNLPIASAEIGGSERFRSSIHSLYTHAYCASFLPHQAQRPAILRSKASTSYLLAPSPRAPMDLLSDCSPTSLSRTAFRRSTDQPRSFIQIPNITSISQAAIQRSGVSNVSVFSIGSSKCGWIIQYSIRDSDLGD